MYLLAVYHGLLSIFFFVVGLEIKREFTVGHLSTFRSGALPVIAAFGGILLPALIYAGIAPPELRHGWGIPIGTDTAFAVALIVLLGPRVPIELRVFLTAAVIIACTVRCHMPSAESCSGIFSMKQDCMRPWPE